MPSRRAGVRVALTRNGETSVAVTNASGIATMGRDAGTYQVTLGLTGWSYTPTSLVVSADASVPLAMTAISIP